MLTIFAFLLALGLLIAVHEYGHYRMAVACSVKVLRFSIGFGRIFWRWQPKGSPTEFVFCVFPLGGYVRMLDEREAAVAAHEKHLTFNKQPLHARALIVAAGPAANLLLAVLLYAFLNWSGVEMASPVLGRPVAESLAERAGLTGGEWVQQVGFEDAALEEVRSFEEVRWFLVQAALQGRDARLVLGDDATGANEREVLLPLSRLNARDADAGLMARIGVLAPWSRPLIGQVMPGSAAERAGLRSGDLILRLGDQSVSDARHLRELIRASVRDGRALVSKWQIERDGVFLVTEVVPDLTTEGDALVGRIGAYVGGMPQMLVVRYGWWSGLWQGVKRTWDISVLTLKTMGRMLIGEASLQNLSGPLTIADYAGKSASQGLTHYLTFLALISVSLGVLNLLPLPMLDGGHLMYYFYEGVTGHGISELWHDRLQRAGVGVLALMMSVALFNDLVHLFG